VVARWRGGGERVEAGVDPRVARATVVDCVRVLARRKSNLIPLWSSL